MKEDRSVESQGQRSWLERLGQVLSGEPRDREELREILADAQASGVLDAEALAMMEGVLEVAEMQVRDVMIPRAQMVVVERDWSPEQVTAEVLASGHSRFPVIGEGRDEVLGILIVKDLLRYYARGGGPFDITEFMRPARFIPESKRLDALLREFRSTRLHMAMVVDEYGGVAGLVTIEDLLEQIVGEIDDEHDASVETDDIRAVGEFEYVVKALTPLEDFNEYFASDFDEDEVDTVGGLVMKDLDHVPRRGEVVDIGRFRFRVLRADNRRVHLFGLTLMDAGTATAE